MRKKNGKKYSTVSFTNEKLSESDNSPPTYAADFSYRIDKVVNFNGNRNLPNLVISESVMQEIRQTIGNLRAEQGGPLGGNRDSGVVTDFHFDNSARRTGASYSPDTELLNKLFAEEWNPQGINLLGFVHSHPPSFRQPSGGDIEYATRILAAIPELEYLYLPIIMTEPDTGTFTLLPFVALRDGETVKIKQIELVVVSDKTLHKSDNDCRETVANISTKPESNKQNRKFSSGIFERVQNRL